MFRVFSGLSPDDADKFAELETPQMVTVLSDNLRYFAKKKGEAFSPRSYNHGRKCWNGLSKRPPVPIQCWLFGHSLASGSLKNPHLMGRGGGGIWNANWGPVDLESKEIRVRKLKLCAARALATQLNRVLHRRLTLIVAIAVVSPPCGDDTIRTVRVHHVAEPAMAEPTATGALTWDEGAANCCLNTGRWMYMVADWSGEFRTLPSC